MSNIKRLIKDKREYIKEKQTELFHKSTVANQLGFTSSVREINNDLDWVVYIIDLLDDLEDEIDNNDNGHKQ